MASDPDAQVVQLTTALAGTQSQLQAVRASLQLAQSALGAVADALAIVDTHGRITFLNQVGMHMTGWREHEALGRRFLDIAQFADARGRPVDVLSAGFCNGGDDVVSLRRRDGHVILVDGSVAQVHDHERQVVGTVVTFRNVTAATRLTRELAYHANHDPLTGLHNRRAFEAHLRRVVASSAAAQRRHTLLYFDLDKFKTVNDSAGHVAGDALLRQLAVLLRRQLREHDGLARLGGDEFAVLLENCTSEQADRVAEKIRAAVAGFAFEWDQRLFRIATSIGQVDFTDDALSSEELIGIADRMCYAAKAGGGNRVAVHRRRGDRASTSGRDAPRRPGARAQVA